MNRIIWVDTLKFIGIFFVVLGHLSLPSNITIYIYSFHMPLFFLLAGFVYKAKTDECSRTFIQKKYNSILSPYLLFSFISYLFWILIGRHFGEDKLLDINPLKPFIGIFYANGHDHWMQHNLPLWFLPCLFLVELIFFTIDRKTNNIKQKMSIVTLFVLIGFLNSKTINIPLPLSANTAFIALSFFSFGYLAKDKISKINPPIYLSLILIVIAYFISKTNQRVDMQSNQYNNIVLFYFSALLNIVGYIGIVKKLPQISIFNFFGRNTIIILAFHGMALSFIKGFQVFILKLPLDFLKENLYVSVLYAILSLILITPLLIINMKLNLLNAFSIRLTKT